MTEQPRLNAEHLATLDRVAHPRFDRAALQPRMLHIGVGNFFRAHQALYTDDANDAKAASGDLWGILGASLRTPTAAEQLNPQNGLYTVATIDGTKVDYRIGGAIRHVTTLPQDGMAPLLSAFADPNLHIVTITVTEKGYCQGAQGLDRAHPDIAQDLTTPDAPVSLIGVLAAGLRARHKAGGAPLTIISCDNLSGNGSVLEQVTNQFLHAVDADAARWLIDNVRFPNTMVDRIVPRTTEADHAALASAHGYRDDALVVCEPFRQWVIEDRFAGPRPAWEQAGVLIVDDVAAFERTKLRLLNGPHSASAYLGLLQGYDYVHQVMQDATLREFLRHLVTNELHPVLAAPPGLTLAGYSDEVFTRFANTGVAYGTRQVATDGSQKLPQRLIPVIATRLAQGLNVEALALVCAAWVAHLKDPAPDPLQSTLTGLYHAHTSNRDLAAAMVNESTVFDGLGDHRAAFVEPLNNALTDIRSAGILGAIESRLP